MQTFRNVKQVRPHLFMITLMIGMMSILTLVMINPLKAYNGELPKKAIQLGDLPNGARWLTNELVTPDMLGHPLNRSVKTKGGAQGTGVATNTAFSYESAYAETALVPDKRITVSNYLYQYPSVAAAHEAANILRQDLNKMPQLVSLKDYLPPQSASTLRGAYVAILAGNEGETISWIVGVKGDTLFMLMVDGMDQNVVAQVLDSVARKAAE